MPRYYVDIACIDTGQRLFTGCYTGPIAPLLSGEILERAKVTDAGKRLTEDQRKGAYYANRAR